MTIFTYYDDVVSDVLLSNEFLRKKLTSFGKENLELVSKLKQKDYELACTRNQLAVDSRVQETISTLQNENSQWKKRAENAEYALRVHKSWMDTHKEKIEQVEKLKEALDSILELRDCDA